MHAENQVYSTAKNERGKISAKPNCMGVIIETAPTLLQLRRRKKTWRCDVIQKKQESKQMVQLVWEALLRFHLECNRLCNVHATQPVRNAGESRHSDTRFVRVYGQKEVPGCIHVWKWARKEMLHHFIKCNSAIKMRELKVNEPNLLRQVGWDYLQKGTPSSPIH